jgi:hypothetical protein
MPPEEISRGCGLNEINHHDRFAGLGGFTSHCVSVATGSSKVISTGSVNPWMLCDSIGPILHLSPGKTEQAELETAI